jgi:hypothetical protein
MAFTSGTFGAPLDLDLQLRRPLGLDLHRSEPSLVCSVLSRACGAAQGDGRFQDDVDGQNADDRGS